MPQPNVVVRKQLYDVRARSREVARDLHRRLERAHQERVVAVLTELMQEVAADGDLLLIDRLELDLGTLRADCIEEQLAERIGERLREQLAGGMLDGLRELEHGSAVRRLQGARAGLELLGAFLSTGVLPWWAAGDSASLAERLDEALERSPGELAAMLRRSDAGRTAPRLARQFPGEQVQRVVALLAGPCAPAIVAALQDWTRCCEAAGGARGGRLPSDAAMRAGAGVLQALCEGAADVDEVSARVLKRLTTAGGGAELGRQLLAAARRFLPADNGVRRTIERAAAAPVAGALPVALVQPSDGRTGAMTPPTAPRQPASAAPPAGAVAGPEPGRDARDAASSAAPDGVPRNGEGPKTSHDAVAAPSSSTPRARRTDGEGPDAVAARSTEVAGTPLHAVEAPLASPAWAPDVVDGDVGALVDNAGLVLLWPFLPRFFAELGLVDGGVFVGERQRERAVQLLHRVATGDTDTPEHRLLLNKLLCGFVLEEPVAGSIVLSEGEAREIDELYDSVLHNWQAVGSTSAEGLRASFLQRDGVLSRQELGWNLKVARLAYDVLLDRLPWGIGLVMLPWMLEPLVVEW